MATINYKLQIDDSDKQRAEQVFKKLGMTFSTGLDLYIKTVIRQQGMPFDAALAVSHTTTTLDEKEKAFTALNGILAGHEVDLNNERAERVLSL